MRSPEKDRDEALRQILHRDRLPTQQWWLSFATEEGFRGAVVVHAETFTEAVVTASLWGINPGGEVQGLPCAVPVSAKWTYRLLSREECERFEKEMTN